MEKKRKFADDLDQGETHPEEESGRDINQYDSLHDKWNDIQEAYLEKHLELETEDLVFEGGGFGGLLEKIAEIQGKTVKEVRTEIETW